MIGAGLLLRCDHDQFLGSIAAGTGIVIAGDHGGAVVACLFADKQGCTGHDGYLF